MRAKDSVSVKKQRWKKNVSDARVGGVQVASETGCQPWSFCLLILFLFIFCLLLLAPLRSSLLHFHPLLIDLHRQRKKPSFSNAKCSMWLFQSGKKLLWLRKLCHVGNHDDSDASPTPLHWWWPEQPLIIVVGSDATRPVGA